MKTALFELDRDGEAMLQLQFMMEFYDVQDIDDLGLLISKLVPEDGNAAFWLHRDGQCELALSLSGPFAAVYRAADCTWSYSDGEPEDQFVAFTLENGQIDDFALPQCVTREDGIVAFIDTAVTGELSSRIDWY